MSARAPAAATRPWPRFRFRGLLPLSSREASAGADEACTGFALSTFPFSAGTGSGPLAGADPDAPPAVEPESLPFEPFAERRLRRRLPGPADSPGVLLETDASAVLRPVSGGS